MAEPIPVNIEKLLMDLHSAEAYVRKSAAEEIGRLSTSNEQIVSALVAVWESDSDKYVRRAAKESILSSVHAATLHRLPGWEEKITLLESATETAQPETTLDTMPIPFWLDRTTKIMSILLSFALAGIFTFPLFAFEGSPIIIFNFPLGLLRPLNVYGINPRDDSNIKITVLGWLFYLGISATIVISSRKNVVRSLLVILIMVLILNVGGCYSFLNGIN